MTPSAGALKNARGRGMHPEPVFRLFGPAHLFVIFLTISVPVVLGVAVRRTGSRTIDRAVGIGLSLLLVSNYLGYANYLWQRDLLVWQRALPFQLCDWAMVTIIVALFSHRRGWIEVSYFWGIAGTFQAILTPNLPVNLPDIRAISFFITHCGIVVGVIYILIARRFRRRSVRSGAPWPGRSSTSSRPSWSIA